MRMMGLYTSEEWDEANRPLYVQLEELLAEFKAGKITERELELAVKDLVAEEEE